MIDLLPNITLVYQWVIFMTALLTLHFVVFKPTLRILAERKNRTEGEKELAHALEEKGQGMLAQVTKRMDEARHAGARKKEDLRSIATKFSEDVLKKTRRELEEKMEQTRQVVEKESREAALQLRQQARDLAQDIAVKVLERDI